MGIKRFLVAGLAAGVVMSVWSVTAMADSTGWRGNDEEGWRYYTSDTDYVIDQWYKVNGKWYYLDEDGIALTDTWAVINEKMYHFDKSGAMDSNKWLSCGEYEFKIYEDYDEEYKEYMSSYAGKLNWRYVGSDGAAVTGWQTIGGKKYYFEDYDYNPETYAGYAVMAYGWFYDEDRNYYNFDGNGQLRKEGWFKYTTFWGFVEWFYFDAEGKAYTGWHKIDNKWYYFGSPDSWDTYYMRTGCVKLYDDDEVWYFSQNGELLTGWIREEQTEWDSEEGDYVFNGKYTWYYAASNGSCYHSEWLKYGNNWYFFNEMGEMIADKDDYYIKGKLYDFDENGVCTNPDTPDAVTGFYKISRGCGDDTYYSYKEVYVDEKGIEYRSRWLESDGYWYYFDETGRIVKNEDNYVINGKSYDFDYEGKCLNPDEHPEGWFENKNGKWMYYGSDGRFYTGWHRINNKWYYFSVKGIMYTGRYWVFDGEDDYEGKKYIFNGSGEMLTGWIYNENNWYYADPDGEIYSEKWLNDNGTWYYFDNYSRMLHGVTDVYINGKLYDFDETGACTNPYSGRAKNILLKSIEGYFS